MLDIYAPPASDTRPGSPDAHLQTGGFGLRAGARLIDTVVTAVLGVVAGLLSAVVCAVLQAAGATTAGSATLIGEVPVAEIVGSFVASVLYFAVAEAIGGATLGKVVTGLRVVGEDLRPCGPGAALGRELAYYVDVLFFGAPAYVSMRESTRDQRLGDKWAKTYVARSESLPTASRPSSGLVAVGVLAGVAVHVAVMVATTVGAAI